MRSQTSHRHNQHSEKNYRDRVNDRGDYREIPRSFVNGWPSAQDPFHVYEGHGQGREPNHAPHFGDYGRFSPPLNTGGYTYDDYSQGSLGRERDAGTVGKFFGVGPKGYQRSDERIKEDVCECLYAHHDIDASDIEVEVKEGTVSLSGSVDSRRTKRMIEDEIEHLPGIRDIANHLRLRVQSSDVGASMAYGATSAPAPGGTNAKANQRV